MFEIQINILSSVPIKVNFFLSKIFEFTETYQISIRYFQPSFKIKVEITILTCTRLKSKNRACKTCKVKFLFHRNQNCHLQTLEDLSRLLPHVLHVERVAELLDEVGVGHQVVRRVGTHHQIHRFHSGRQEVLKTKMEKIYLKKLRF